MSQLSVFPPVSQPPGAGAAQAASSAMGAEAGCGLECAQGASFGAVLGRQMKGIAALLEGRDAHSLSGALADGGEVGESAGNDAAMAIIRIDFSSLTALVSPQISDLPQDSSDLVQDSSVVLQDPALLPIQPLQPTLTLSWASSAGHGSGGRAGFLSDENGAEVPALDMRPTGEARLAAEIAANGKSLPPAASPERQFADKLAALVEVSAGNAGGELHPTDLPAAANASATVGVFRNSEPLPALPVAPRVASAEWGGAVGEKVVWMANQNHQVAELHLNPPNLGPLEVRLTIGNDQASALFVSPHSAVREAIETALPRLREMLADNGIMLGNVTVGSEPFGQQHASDQKNGKEGNRSGLGAESVMSRMAVPGRSAGLACDGMVDIFA